MRSFKALGYSVVGHGLAIGALVLVPLLWPSDSPVPFNATRVMLVYNPPPPPLPKGSATGVSQLVRPVTPEKTLKQPKVPDTQPTPAELAPEADPRDEGVQAGVENGVEGGVPEGVDGGVLGGVIGGTGTVADYDQPPRLIRQVLPVYTKEAFVKGIRGIVEVEFVIEADGRVSRAWVVSSQAPALNTAAVAAVMQWLFVPALKHGSPVATIARAPVKFSLI